MFFELKMNFFVMILISCCLGTGYGRLTKVPRNVVALVRTTATLECCNGVGHHSLLWRRVLFGTRESSDIYLGESLGFVDNFGEGRFKISNGNTSGCSNIVISAIRFDDAGTYTCAVEYDLEDSASADVTILESFACHEEFPNKEVYMGKNEFELKPDMLQLRCSIKYKGRFIPEMQWKWKNSSKTSNFNTYIANFNATLNSTSTATIVAEKEFDRNEITCFIQSPGDEDLSRKIVNWTSKLYNINYAIFSKKAVVNCTAEELDLECNPPCSISSVAGSNGSYVCEISYLNEMKQYYYEREHEVVVLACFWTTAEVAAIIAVMGVAVVALSFVIGILNSRLRKIRGNQRYSNELIDCNGQRIQ